jgi:hypothetical protein
MAKIRTQPREGGRRIITKLVGAERRVSCSCCATGECCLYPATAFNNGDITIEDLPDKIKFLGGEFTKNTPPLDASGNTGTPFLIYYGFVGEGIGIENGTSQWTQQTDFSTGISNDCLVTDGLDGWYTDDFEDTYTVTTYETFQISRTGLCTWFGLDSNGCETLLEYLGVPSDLAETENAYKWVLSWSGAFDPGQEGCASARLQGAKEGFQNSPTGTYTDPLAFVSATIA